MLLISSIIVVPFALLFLMLEWHLSFTKAQSIWAKILLLGSGFYIDVKNNNIVLPTSPFIIVTNHTSFLDILVILTHFKNRPITFVSKKEVVNYPIVGYFTKKAHILVDRNNQKSKAMVYTQAKKFIQNNYSICIFPEGGIWDNNQILNSFKNGAFTIAIEQQIPIVVATIGLLNQKCPNLSFQGKLGKIDFNYVSILETKGLTKNNVNDLKERAFELMQNKLLTYE